MSKRIHTHYDNLKVAQDAPIEVIRAAYRSLCKKYHPDQNRDNPDAHRIMSLINRSYAVLSDPEQRRAHDEWIAAQQQGWGSEMPLSPPMPAQAEPMPSENLLRQRRFWLGLAFFVFLLGGLFWLAQQQREAAADMPPRAVAASEHYPEFAQYLDGYPVLAERGNGMVKIDNRRNRSAVFVQIYPAKGDTAIRTVYIPAHADFTAFKLAAGTYRIRYRQLVNDTWEAAGFTVQDEQTRVNVVLENAPPDVL